MSPRGCVKNFRPWTEAEVAILREFYPREFQAVKERLPGRSAQCCRSKASTLGICVERHWTDVEDQRLRSLWGEQTVKGIGATLKRSSMSVHCRSRKLGLKQHAPEGWEAISASATRVGMSLAALRGALRWAAENGIPSKGYEFERLAFTARRNGTKYHQHIVESFEVDLAIEAWCKSEQVEVAARERGMSGPTLRRILRAAGVAKPAARVHWRVRSEVIDEAIAKVRGEKRAA